MLYRLFPAMDRTGHPKRANRCRIGVEQLEDRLVPSSTPAALAVQTQALVNPANLGSGVQFQRIAAGAYQTVASQTVTVGPGQTGLFNLNFQAQAFDAISNRAGVRYLTRGEDLVLTPGEDFTLRLRPVEPLSGRVAVFTTGPAPTEHLDADVVHISRNLARRDLLAAELRSIDADTYLVEIMATAIDIVVEHALARGARVVLADNEVVAPGLDEAILALVPQGIRA